MRLWIFSDLHVDVTRGESYDLPRPHPACDAVVIAGDIREHGDRGIKWIVNQGFDVPVVYVLGNHEFYRNSRDRGLVKTQAAAQEVGGIHVLQDGFVDIAGVRIIGATLWTDYLLYGDAWQAPAMDICARGMNDHRLIRIAANGYGRWLPKHCAAEHQASRSYIEAMLSLDHDGPLVVVTHHAPSIKSLDDRYAGTGLLNAAYASDLERLVDRSSLWVHGHIHKRQDYQIGDGRVVANPRGYWVHGEGEDFDPHYVIEV